MLNVSFPFCNWNILHKNKTVFNITCNRRSNRKMLCSNTEILKRVYLAYGQIFRIHSLREWLWLRFCYEGNCFSLVTKHLLFNQEYWSMLLIAFKPSCQLSPFTYSYNYPICVCLYIPLLYVLLEVRVA